jgi:hypothetical protein
LSRPWWRPQPRAAGVLGCDRAVPRRLASPPPLAGSVGAMEGAGWPTPWGRSRGRRRGRHRGCAGWEHGGHLRVDHERDGPAVGGTHLLLQPPLLWLPPPPTRGYLAGGRSLLPLADGGAADGVELPRGRRWGRAPPRPVRATGEVEIPRGRRAQAPPMVRPQSCPRRCATSDLGWRHGAPLVAIADQDCLLGG